MLIDAWESGLPFADRNDAQTYVPKAAHVKGRSLRALRRVRKHVVRRTLHRIAVEDAAIRKVVHVADRVLDHAVDVVAHPALGLRVVLRGVNALRERRERDGDEEEGSG